MQGHLQRFGVGTEERLLLGGGGDDVHEIAVRREVALAHHRRDRDLQVDVSEQRDVVVVLVGVVGRGKRRGQTDDERRTTRRAEPREQGGHHERPVVEQVMALVEDHRFDPDVDEPIDQLTGVRVQRRHERLGVVSRERAPQGTGAGPDAAPVRGRVARRERVEPARGLAGRARVGLQFVEPAPPGETGERVGGVDDADRLVGQRGEDGRGLGVVGDGGGVGREPPGGRNPLRADRHGRGEHHRASAPAHRQ